MKFKKHILLFISAFIFSALPSYLWAANFNISCCNPEDIRTALSTAQSNGANDTLSLAAGTYTISTGGGLTYTAASGENYSLTMNASGGPVTLSGDAGLQVLRITAYVGGENSSAAHVSIDGITFDSGRISSTFFSGAGLFVRTNGANITINDCVFSNNISSGLFEDPSGGGAYFRAGTGAIILTNNVFTNNVADIYGGGAYVYGDSGGSVKLINNTFRGNQSKSSAIGGGGLYMKVWGTTDIYNNIIRGNTASTGADIYLDKSTSTVNLYNNDFSDLAYDDATNLTQSNNINRDPLLNSNFQLGDSSPCIDAGLATAPSLPSSDFDGQSRVMGSAPDMGADEYYIYTTTVPSLSPRGMVLLSILMMLVFLVHGSRNLRDYR